MNPSGHSLRPAAKWRTWAGICLLFALLLAGILVPTASQAAESRTPVLLIHGVNGSPNETWPTALATLQKAGYHQGVDLFAIDLSHTGAQNQPLGLLSDAGAVEAEIQRILQQTGSAQVDLVGHSRGGLIVRLLASGETSALVRRAVTLDAPFDGVLSADAMQPMLSAMGLGPAVRAQLIPGDLEATSLALATLQARAKHFADRQVPALVMGTTWHDGVPAYLAGNDGFVALHSQLDWPGARTFTAQLGPDSARLQNGPSLTTLATESPHSLSHEDDATLKAMVAFLMSAEVPAADRACAPSCQDWTALQGHWAAPEVLPWLPGKLPYDVDSRGQREFQPNRPMTRAEFIYGLDHALGLQEVLTAPNFKDTPGHWAFGYIEAASAAHLVNGLTPETAGPDQPLTRAQAATLVVKARGLQLASLPSRFADVRGHWAEAYIETAAANGIMVGDARGARPDAPVTLAEGAAILVRTFGK